MNKLSPPRTARKRERYQLNVGAVSTAGDAILLGIHDPAHPKAGGGYLLLTRAALEELPARLYEFLAQDQR